MWYCLSPLPVAIAHICYPLLVAHCQLLSPRLSPVHISCSLSLNALLPLTALPIHHAPTLHQVSSFITLTPSIALFPPLCFSLHCALPPSCFSLHGASPSIVLFPPLHFSLHCCHCLSRPSSHPMLPKPLLSLVSAVPSHRHCCCCLLLSPITALSLVMVSVPTTIAHHCCHCHFHCC